MSCFLLIFTIVCYGYVLHNGVVSDKNKKIAELEAEILELKNERI